MISSFATDTGFDVICCSCLQYKTLQNCKQIDILSSNQQKKFLIKPCFLLRNRNDAFYVCIPCKVLIDKNQMPKKSHKKSFQFANFPSYLIEKLKKNCKLENSSLSRYFNEDQEIYERRALQLNKLESFLLKQVIPFIRIAHCPQEVHISRLWEI